MTITVGVEKSHEAVGFSAGNADLDLAEAGVELLGVNLVVAVEGIEVSESSAETSDGLGTTCSDLGSNSLEDYTQDETVRSVIKMVEGRLCLESLSERFHISLFFCNSQAVRFEF